MRITVLGCGPSIEKYRYRGELTVGVNDIWKHFHVDYLFLADPPARFTGDQIRIIENSKPQIFFAFEPQWRHLQFFVQCHRLFQDQPVFTNDRNYLPFSYDSTYSAVCLAYKLGATEIVMHGVDLRDHPALYLYWQAGKIHYAYKALAKWLQNHGAGLYTSKYSPLSEFIPVKK